MTFPAASETREGFRYFTRITTRWRDSDVYHHVNNAVYNSWIDTAVADFLVKEANLSYAESPVVGFIVESFCQFRAPVSYPEAVEAGVRVAHLGRTSVRYEVGIFRENVAEAVAVGYFVHVFVDRKTSESQPIPAAVRDAMSAIQVDA